MSSPPKWKIITSLQLPSVRCGGMLWLYYSMWKTCNDWYFRRGLGNHMVWCVFILVLYLEYSSIYIYMSVCVCHLRIVVSVLVCYASCRFYKAVTPSEEIYVIATGVTLWCYNQRLDRNTVIWSMLSWILRPHRITKPKSSLMGRNFINWLFHTKFVSRTGIPSLYINWHLDSDIFGLYVRFLGLKLEAAHCWILAGYTEY